MKRALATISLIGFLGCQNPAAAPTPVTTETPTPKPPEVIPWPETTPSPEPEETLPEEEEEETSPIDEEEETEPAEEEEEEEEEPEPEVIPLTDEQKIRHFGEKVCAVEDIDIHSEDALEILEFFSVHGLELREFDIYASPAQVKAQCYVGSELHARLTGALHAEHIANFSKTLNTSLKVGGLVTYDLSNNNKVNRIDFGLPPEQWTVR
jgi:hypothetical protein